MANADESPTTTIVVNEAFWKKFDATAILDAKLEPLRKDILVDRIAKGYGRIAKGYGRIAKGYGRIAKRIAKGYGPSRRNTVSSHRTQFGKEQRASVRSGIRQGGPRYCSQWT
jgi:hypothetical protein